MPPDFGQETERIVLVPGVEGVRLDSQIYAPPKLHEVDLGIEAVGHTVQYKGDINVAIRPRGSPRCGLEKKRCVDAISSGAHRVEKSARDRQSLLLIHTRSSSISPIMAAVYSLVHLRANSCL